MKKINIIMAAVLMGLVTIAGATAFTDINSPQYYGKINIPKTHAAIDANFELIEAGTATVTLGANKLWVGNDASNQTAMAVAGDVTISQDGTNVTTAIAAGVVVNADINSAAAIAHTKLAAVDPGYLLVGNASSQAVAVAVSGDVTMGNNGAVAIAADSIVDADVNTSAAIASTKLSGVAAAPAVAGSVSGTTNTVTITANDGAGATLAAKRLVRVWMSETSGGVPSTNNIESVTLSGGAAIQTITAAADYVYLTAATGIASAEVIGTAAGTNYMNVADGGYVTSAAVVFE